MTQHDVRDPDPAEARPGGIVSRAVRTGSAAGGTALAAVIRGVAAVRPSPKPLHPSGEVITGTLERHGSPVASGVAWLDGTGTDDVVVRLSRAIGLPEALPDIHGLALRVPVDGGHDGGYGDALLASTGTSRLGRFVLTFGQHPGSRPLTTLLPYRTTRGALWLGARATGPTSYELAWAGRDAQWQRFATLELTTTAAPDQDISFDPVRHQLPGLDQYSCVTRLREPSYLDARRSRRG
jgi:hypothetical protein